MSGKRLRKKLGCEIFQVTLKWKEKNSSKLKKKQEVIVLISMLGFKFSFKNLSTLNSFDI